MFPKKIFLILFSLASMVPINLKKNNILSSDAKVKSVIQTKNDDEIISSNVVARYYYEKSKSRLLKKGIEIVSIEAYVQSFRKQNNSLAIFCETFENTSDYSISTISSSSGIASYILGYSIGSSDYTKKEYFQQKPLYQAFDYSILEDGDIIYESGNETGGFHVAFLYNSKQDSYYGNYLQTIEAVPDKVQYGFLDDDRILRYGVSIYRVYRAKELSTVKRAKDFIVKQVGKNYSYDYTKTDISVNETEWYCSELVYAAYCAGGMDIVSNSSSVFNPNTTVVFPIQLTTGSLTYRIAISTSWVELSVDSFNNKKWEINVYNPNTFGITLEYNSKMCYQDDAKNWNKLNDIKSIYISSFNTKTVSIEENWFATTIALSFVNDNKRYVSYANELTKGAYTLSVKYSTLNIA